MYVFPNPLSTKDEIECLNKMSEGDEDARKTLIEHNLRLVGHIVKKYNIKESNIEDIISIGTIGLIKAVDTFKINKNYKLATYAARCIENEILMEFRNDKKLSREVYMYDVIKVDEGGNNLSIIDMLETYDIDVVEKIYTKENVKRMYDYIEDTLTDRERAIISYRYGIYGKQSYTQRQIATKLGISRSYVSRIEKKALEKLYTRFIKTV